MSYLDLIQRTKFVAAFRNGQQHSIREAILMLRPNHDAGIAVIIFPAERLCKPGPTTGDLTYSACQFVQPRLRVESLLNQHDLKRKCNKLRPGLPGAKNALLPAFRRPFETPVSHAPF